MRTAYRLTITVAIVFGVSSLVLSGPRRGKSEKPVSLDQKGPAVALPPYPWPVPHPFMYPHPSAGVRPKLISAPTFVAASDVVVGDSTPYRATYLVEVDTDGMVYAYLLESSTGSRDLDEKCAQVVQQCRFEPAFLDSVAVPEWVKAECVLTPSDSGFIFSIDCASKLLQSELLPDTSDEFEYPNMISMETARMPNDFKFYGQQAVVWVTAYVSPIRETPLIVRVTKSSNWPTCDIEALRAPRLCRFTPSIRNGVPEPSWVTFNYDFRVN